MILRLDRRYAASFSGHDCLIWINAARKLVPSSCRAFSTLSVVKLARDPLERFDMSHQIPGTPIFDGAAAQKGYALNRMCFSFNRAENSADFLRDEDAYCFKFGLTPEQRLAVKHRNVLELIEAGGNVYYLAKLAGIFGLNVQDIGAQQTGMTVEAFKAKLAAAGR
jgi:protocatechuate 4,5-dioxygenase alpha chain